MHCLLRFMLAILSSSLSATSASPSHPSINLRLPPTLATTPDSAWVGPAPSWLYGNWKITCKSDLHCIPFFVFSPSHQRSLVPPPATHLLPCPTPPPSHVPPSKPHPQTPLAPPTTPFTTSNTTPTRSSPPSAPPARAPTST